MDPPSSKESVRRRGLVENYELVATAQPKAHRTLGIGNAEGSASSAPPRRRRSLGDSNATSKSSLRKRDKLAAVATKLLGIEDTEVSASSAPPRRCSRSLGDSNATSKSPPRKRDKLAAAATKLLGIESTVGSSSISTSEYQRLQRADSSNVLGAGEIITPATTTTSGKGSKWRRRHRQVMDERILRSNPVFQSLYRKEKFRFWASSFRRLDPRYSILRYFNDCALGGLKNISDEEGVDGDMNIPPLLRAFRRSAVFTVWRPTSKTAIRRMMLGEGTGKGLNVTGKSAKGDGKLSGYVPFVQIHEEDHKGRIKELPPDGTVRIFYRERDQRTEVIRRLGTVLHKMTEAVEGAMAALMKEGHSTESKCEEIIEKWDMEDPSIEVIDNYASDEGRGHPCYGIEIPERLFWEAYVVNEDISREPGTDYDTQRPSMPHYQDMNFLSTRNYNPKKAPRTVVWQHADPKKGECPMDPRTLLVAYEQNDGVLPVVSDFDGFLVGTRGVTYEQPLVAEQVKVMDWCIDNIEDILDKREHKSWPHHWLDAMKHRKPPLTEKPKYGYGDPKSYSIMLHAAGRMSKSGAVRHGPECFNYSFPQDLDDEYLVIHGDAEAGKVPWTYVNEAQLRILLCRKISEGYTFPLNPKWVLCYPGWKDVYDSLTSSEEANVRESLNCWYPPGSRIRQRIEAISARHPDGLFFPEKGEEYAERLQWEQELQREHYFLFEATAQNETDAGENEPRKRALWKKSNLVRTSGFRKTN